ncbi:unnamed protein product, partial [Larinioides sclopetarius]
MTNKLPRNLFHSILWPRSRRVPCSKPGSMKDQTNIGSAVHQIIRRGQKSFAGVMWKHRERSACSGVSLAISSQYQNFEIR